MGGLYFFLNCNALLKSIEKNGRECVLINNKKLKLISLKLDGVEGNPVYVCEVWIPFNCISWSTSDSIVWKGLNWLSWILPSSARRRLCNFIIMFFHQTNSKCQICWLHKVKEQDFMNISKILLVNTQLLYIENNNKYKSC